MPKHSRLAAAFFATLSFVVGAAAGCSSFGEEEPPSTVGPDAEADAAESSRPDGAIADAGLPPDADEGGADSGLDCADPSILLCDGFERSNALAPPWTSEVMLGGGTLATSDQPLFHGKSLSTRLGTTAGIASSAALVFTLNSMNRSPNLRARFSFYIPIAGATTAPKAPVTIAKIVLGDPPADAGVMPGNIAVTYDPVTGPSLVLVDNFDMKGVREPVTPGGWYDVVFSVSGAALKSTATLTVAAHAGGIITTRALQSVQKTVNGPHAVTIGISLDGTEPQLGGELPFDDVIISSF